MIQYNQRLIQTNPSTELRTRDLWQSAFMLAKGGELKELQLSTKGSRQEVIFIITGKNIHHLKQEFQSGQAICRVRLLKSSMNHLKDEIFRVTRN